MSIRYVGAASSVIIAAVVLALAIYENTPVWFRDDTGIQLQHPRSWQTRVERGTSEEPPDFLELISFTSGNRIEMSIVVGTSEMKPFMPSMQLVSRTTIAGHAARLFYVPGKEPIEHIVIMSSSRTFVVSFPVPSSTTARTDVFPPPYDFVLATLQFP
jgi:hypothetical protein